MYLEHWDLPARPFESAPDTRSYYRSATHESALAQIQYAAPRAGDVKHSQASIDKITQAGFTPGASFNEGLTKTIEYFSQKSHQ